MLKRFTISQFILISILAVLLVVLAIVPLNIPFSKLVWNGFYDATQKGQDIGDSVYMEYKVKLPGSEEDEEKLKAQTDKMVKELYSLFTGRGYKEVNVFNHTNGIRVELPYDNASWSMLAILGEPSEILISGKATAEEALTDINSVKGKQIQSATGVYTGSTYGVEIKFDKEGTAMFRTLTDNVALEGQTIYIYSNVNGNWEAFNNGNNTISGITEEIKDGILMISGGMSTLAAAQNYALKITSGAFPVLLSVKEQDRFVTEANSNIQLIAPIVFISLFVLLLTYVIIKYRAFGLVAALAMLFFLGINLFLFSTVPFITFTLTTFIGFLLATLMAINNIIITNEQIRKEVKLGKKLPTAVNQAFKKTWVSLTMANVLVTVVSFILIWFTSGVVRSLIESLFITSMVSGIISLLLARGLMILALRVNSSNYKAYGCQKPAIKTTKEVSNA